MKFLGNILWLILGGLLIALIYYIVGLWKRGRHPNYFGEVAMWWGVWLMYASIFGIDALVAAPIAMSCLFLFISIPMMEKRQLENKPGYADYRKRTRIMI